MNKKLLILFISVITLFAVSCGKSGGLEESAQFNNENELPNLMVVTDDTYYIMTCKNGEGDYRLSVSDKVDELNFVYDSKYTNIPHLYAEDDYAGWIEEYDHYYDYKVYDREKNKVISINRVDSGKDGYQNMQMGIYDEKLYYDLIDYDNGKTYIKSYDLETGKHSTVHEADFPEAGPNTLEVKEGVLLAYRTTTKGGLLFRKDLETGKEENVHIPDAVDHLYAASYDKSNDTYAVYYVYENSEEEHLGIFTTDSCEINEIYTMAAGTYAYHDEITIDKGRLYLVIQNHNYEDMENKYTFIDYDYLNETPEEYQSTFGFALSDDSIYALSFVNGNVSKINISKKNR